MWTGCFLVADDIAYCRWLDMFVWPDAAYPEPLDVTTCSKQRVAPVAMTDGFLATVLGAVNLLIQIMWTRCILVADDIAYYHGYDARRYVGTTHQMRTRSYCVYFMLNEILCMEPCFLADKTSPSSIWTFWKLSMLTLIIAFIIAANTTERVRGIYSVLMAATPHPLATNSVYRHVCSIRWELKTNAWKITNLA